jgi:hypothetical protein
LQPSLSAAVSRPAAKIQTFRRLCPPPTPLATDRCPTIIGSHHGFPSADHFLPRHETNFFVPPPLCSKPSLNEQPSFLPAPLSNSSNKRPRHFQGRKVSIIVCTEARHPPLIKLKKTLSHARVTKNTEFVPSTIVPIAIATSSSPMA